MINIKLVSLKPDKKDLCKYIQSDSQLLIFKITLDYLVYVCMSMCVVCVGMCMCEVSVYGYGRVLSLIHI